ncbi:DNA-binding protein [Luteococcus sediminum]|uniref:DNA-binding protein n=1 Tax=Luteococcus sp. TaxID=1969402 RepID=UPI0037366B89
MDETEHTRAQQAELYGAPLADILGHCAAVLGLNQGGIASLLGISAPMVSQLINGHRIKIANPTAAARLRQVEEAVAEVEAGRLTVEQALTQLRSQPAAALTGTLTRSRSLGAEVQELFRAAAPATDYLAAAERLAEDLPAVAELLRVYGAERTDRAEALTQRLRAG